MPGNLAFVKDELNIIDKSFDIRSAKSLTTVMGTLSGPAAFRFFSCLIAFSIKASSIVFNSISFCTDLMF